MRRAVALALILGLVVLVPLSLRAIETALLYFPVRHQLATPASLGLAAEELRPRAQDGTQLHGWWLTSTIASPAAGSAASSGQGRPVILWFSGNGANASGNLENARRLMERLDVAIVCVDYRGYGLSEGSPTESGLYQDGRAAYDLVRERGVPPHRIVLLGRSLGSAIAADVALDRPSGALVLETPFLSVTDVAKVHYPFIPRFLIKTRYDTASKLARIAVPTLIVQAERDELFAPNHAARLYELSAGSPKHLHVLAGSRHNDVFREQRESYFSAWRDLLTALPRAAGS